MKLWCAIITVLLAAAPAQESGSTRSKQWVTAETPIAVTIAAGKSATVPFHFAVLPGYHINSHKPNSDLYIPTILSFKADSQFTIGTITYPTGKDIQLPLDPDEKLNVYTGAQLLNVTVSAASSTKPGTYTLSGTLRYQACNDNSCFPPKSLPVELNVTVK